MKVKKLKNLSNKIGSIGCKWSNLNAPGTQSTQVGRVPFSIFTPPFSGVIRIGLPAWKWKSWKIWATILAQLVAKGPTWMPQAPNVPIHSGGENFPFPFSALPLWGNKNWPPSMKVKKLKNLSNKIGSIGCKWSNLNTPGSQSTQVGRIPFPIFSPLSLG